MMEKLKRFIRSLHVVLSEFQPSISKNISETRILLWTRKNPDEYVELKIGDLEGLLKSNFNKSNPSKIFFHGFADIGVTNWVQSFKYRYLEKADINVISIDWETLAKSPWYTSAAKNAK